MYDHAIPSGLLALLILPFLTLPDDEGGDEEPQYGGSSQIDWLRAIGDRQALFQLLDTGRQLTQGLEAAEALVELGDVRGLDHLIDTLNGPSSYLRNRAAEILQRLNHPRGLRALHDRRPAPAGSADGRARDQLYADLDERPTDELVAIWHQNDRAQWPDPAFEVLAEILTRRLGRPPTRDDRDPQDIDESADPRVKDLWMERDADGLLHLFESAADVSVQLEAAEALAHLGDEDALDVIIEALDDDDEKVSEMAAQILDWLDLPRGNQALEDRGFDFDAGPGPLAEETEPQPPAAAGASPPPQPARVPDRLMPVTTQMPTAASSLPAWQPPDAAAPVSPALILTGGVGGILGFMLFRFAVHFIGWLPLPQDLQTWLQTSTLIYLAASLIAGAVFTVLDHRLRRPLAPSRDQDASEGDLGPVLAALMKGAVGAVAVDMVLFDLMRF